MKRLLTLVESKTIILHVSMVILCSERQRKLICNIIIVGK